jgi:ubiquinone/menaquinone biosynthesis C-methylase UbiE
MPAIAGKPVESVEELKEYYDHRYREDPIADDEEHYAWMLDLVRPIRNARLLDVACGQGALLKLAADAGLQVAGIDVSSVAAQKAREVCPSGLIVTGDGEHLPWPDGTFDYVFNRGSLEHFIDPAKGSREMARVLKADGRVCITLPNIFPLYDILHTLRTGHGPGVNQQLERFAAVNDWRDFLEENGFKIEQVKRFDGRSFSWKQSVIRFLTPFRMAYHFVYIGSKQPAVGRSGN